MKKMLPLAVVDRLRSDDGSAWHWRQDAACYGTDPEAFYPGHGESNEPAKRICRRCGVQAECLRYALEMGDVNGVWGGTGEGERRKMLRARGEAAVVGANAA